MEANSLPTAPEPTTISDLGIWGRARASSEVMTRFPSRVRNGSILG